MSAFIAMLRMGVRRRALRSMALASVVVALAAAIVVLLALWNVNFP